MRLRADLVGPVQARHLRWCLDRPALVQQLLQLVVSHVHWGVAQLLLELHGAPLLATTLIPANETEPLNDPQEIRARYEKLLDGIVDAGACPLEPTTVIDLSSEPPVLIRQGRGDAAKFGLG